LMLTGGGYPAKERALAKEQRQDILKRDRYICQLRGNAADQVDHIDGDSSDPTNLRALCGECNRKEAFSNTQASTEEDAAAIREMFNDMALRVAAPDPIYLCDSPEHWGKCWRGISGARRRLVGAAPRVRRIDPRGPIVPRSTTCEVRFKRGPWEAASVDLAIELGRSVEKRCVECHGRVRVCPEDHRGAARIEHILEHRGCSLGDCYDGNGRRRHPAFVI
jgi:hypothetical protein